MKAHIRALKGPADHAADNVLPGMLLHMVKPPVPVNASGDLGSCFQGFGDHMPDFSLFFLYNALLRHKDMKEDGMDRALAEAKKVITEYRDEEVLDACFDYVDKTLKEESALLEELGGNLDEPEAKPLSKFVKAMAEKEIEGDERLQEICKFYKMAKLWKKV
jgi:hypothetical protein